MRRRRRDPEAWVSAADTAVAAEIERLRAMTYNELLARLNVTTQFDVPTSTGEVLGGAIEVFWDNEPLRTLRVMVYVLHPTTSVLPTISSDDFIRASDGSFVDE